MALWIDDQIAHAASTIEAGNAAMGAWVRMGAWSCAQLADGSVPRAVALTMASPREVRSLVDAGLVVDHGDRIEIVGYLALNPSRAKVLADREARRAGGRLGAARMWEARRAGSTHDSSDRSTHDSTQAGTHPRVDAPIPSHPIPSQPSSYLR